MEETIKLMTQDLKLKDVYPASQVQGWAEKYKIAEDDLSLVRKGYVPSKADIEEGERAVITYITTAGKDRDREVVLPKGGIFDDFLKNPVVMFCHDYRELPIGKAGWLKKDKKGIISKTLYANTTKANEVFEYRKAGFPLAESIGFMPLESVTPDDKQFTELIAELIGEDIIKRADSKDIQRIYTKWALLEYSDVPVPSNPEALQIAIAKGLIPQTNIVETITKPEETDEWIRIQVAECDVTATIDISKKEGIKALYCGKEKKVRTYMFDKRPPFNWTMARAKKWVEEHKEVDEEALVLAGIGLEEVPEHPTERTIGQAEIKDELDYLTDSIKAEGLNEDNEEIAWELVREIMRLQGNDMPLDIAEKVGAVLNQKNKDKLEQIKTLAQQILDSAQHEEEPKDVQAIEPEITLDEIIQIVKDEVTKAVSKAQGKVN